jgi:MFS family permease
MGASAITNLIFGRLFDRVGFPVAFSAFLFGAMFAPLVFLGQFWLILTGMVLWGIGMGAQSTMLRAMLSEVISPSRRSTGFGLFYTFFGVGWFLGSALMGFLYEKSIGALIVFSVVSQLMALPIFFWGTARSKN